MLLPAAYRATFPLRGIELVTPGILARTPIEGVPLPYRFSTQRDFAGGPPRGLEDMGLVAPEDNPDGRYYPEIRFRFDRLGFPNPSDMTTADVLFVGDSFVFATGAVSPAGLQARLRQRTGLAIMNLAVPAIGPLREEWLLNEVGMAREPRAVIWFFFVGNDLSDVLATTKHRQEGVETYADLFPEFSWPRSFVLDFTIKRFSGKFSQSKKWSTLPGFLFEAEDGIRPVWFSPGYLRWMTRTYENLEASRGWRLAREALLRAAGRLRQAGIPLLMVSVPSKPQVYLPLVAKDEDLLLAAASRGSRGLKYGSAEELWQKAIANADQQELLLKRLCERSDIPFLSLTPGLRELGRQGQLGYFSADTHWNDVGQGVAVDPLADWLRETGVWQP